MKLNKHLRDRKYLIKKISLHLIEIPEGSNGVYMKTIFGKRWLQICGVFPENILWVGKHKSWAEQIKFKSDHRTTKTEQETGEKTMIIQKEIIVLAEVMRVRMSPEHL